MQTPLWIGDGECKEEEVEFPEELLRKLKENEKGRKKE